MLPPRHAATTSCRQHMSFTTTMSYRQCMSSTATMSCRQHMSFTTAMSYRQHVSFTTTVSCSQCVSFTTTMSNRQQMSSACPLLPPRHIDSTCPSPTTVSCRQCVSFTTTISSYSTFPESRTSKQCTFPLPSSSCREKISWSYYKPSINGYQESNIESPYQKVTPQTPKEVVFACRTLSTWWGSKNTTTTGLWTFLLRNFFEFFWRQQHQQIPRESGVQ